MPGGGKSEQFHQPDKQHHDRERGCQFLHNRRAILSYRECESKSSYHKAKGGGRIHRHESRNNALQQLDIEQPTRQDKIPCANRKRTCRRRQYSQNNRYLGVAFPRSGCLKHELYLWKNPGNRNKKFKSISRNKPGQWDDSLRPIVPIQRPRLCHVDRKPALSRVERVETSLTVLM